MIFFLGLNRENLGNSHQYEQRLNITDYTARPNSSCHSHQQHQSISPTKSVTFSDQIENYEYLAVLGKGAFAEVYEAKDRRGGNDRDKPRCAIKQLARHCQSEILVHRKLKHNNIVQLYKVICRPDFNYLILELCQGGNLKQLLTREIKAKRNKFSKSYNYSRSTLSTGKHELNNTSINIIPLLEYDLIRSIIRQLCSALMYLHRNSIIHRDVNLNNLLIVDKIYEIDSSLSPGANDYNIDDIHIKLADFGLAIDLNSRYSQPQLNGTNTYRTTKFPRHSNHHHQSVNFMPVGNTICGTPGFIAPEVIDGQQSAAPSSDAYSVGSVLYAMVTGHVPKRNQLQLSQVPSLLADLITSLLQEDPTKRISIEDMLKHPFMIGPIVAKRLPSISKRTNTMEIVVGPCGSPMIRSLTTQTSIETNPDGTQITIIDKSGRSRKYNMETLPKVHWKKYYHLSAFVDLVKAKVVKVNFYCNQIVSNGLLIEKCCLMENGSLEITISSPNHSLKKSRIVLFDKTETSFENQYVAANELKAVCTQCRLLERDLDRQARQFPNLSQNLFPATFGQRPSKTRSFCSSFDSKKNTDQKLNASIDCGNLSTSRSISILHPEVKYARQSDGYLGVSFIDGSTLKIYFYKNEMVFNNSKGIDYSCKVDLTKLPNLMGVPNELQAKIELIYPYLSTYL